MEDATLHELLNVTMITVITIKIIGFLLILFATFIATVQLTRISDQINKIDSEISNFKDSRIMTALCALSYGEQFTRRRIELFEANENAARGNDISAVADLRKRALDLTMDNEVDNEGQSPIFMFIFQ